MARSRRTEAASRLAQSTEERLRLYVLGVSGASVSVLALASPAAAGIVFTPAHVVLTYGDFSIDLNHDGVTDFLLIDNGRYKTMFTTSCTFCGQYLNVEGSGEVVARNNRVSALVAGAVIGSTDSFQNATRPGLLMASAFNSNFTYRLAGEFANTTHRYLGLKFQIKGETHFGWARLAVVRAGFHVFPRVPFVTAVVTGYAYESAPDTPILAGQTKASSSEGSFFSSSPATVEQASLGRLAQGASGLVAWRRREGHD